MEHLSMKEITGFLNISAYNSRSRALVKRVNGHILSCADCAERLRQAARTAEITEAMNKEDFRNTDVFFSVYDIPAEAVAAEAQTVFESEGTVIH